MKERMLMEQFVKRLEEKVKFIGESKVELFGPLNDAIKVSILFSHNERVDRILRIGESLILDPMVMNLHETELTIELRTSSFRDMVLNVSPYLKVIYYIYEKKVEG